MYLWHPWAGCTVQIHEVVEKASGNVARCSRDGAAAGRSLELPTWMLDRAACASKRMDTRPRVDVAALDALTTLLAEVAVTDAAPSSAPVLGVQTASRDENRGGHDAVPAQCASQPSNQDDTVRSVCRTRRRGGAPAWGALPEETRSALTGLMVQLILDHADARGPQLEEAGHDL
jgi:hypothetical protein